MAEEASSGRQSALAAPRSESVKNETASVEMRINTALHSVRKMLFD
jgi:hypothetical protein